MFEAKLMLNFSNNKDSIKIPEFENKFQKYSIKLLLLTYILHSRKRPTNIQSLVVWCISFWVSTVLWFFSFGFIVSFLLWMVGILYQSSPITPSEDKKERKRIEQNDKIPKKDNS
jgi:acyl-CoA synthetase (AMP-forming)/AMP-acid ligase II